jgi:ribosomal protein S18 acetylase RimI-like enzyme
VGSTAAIRPVVEDDLDHLDEVHPEPGRPTSRHRDRFDLQQQGEGIYLVAWLGGEPVGWVLVLRPGASAASPRAQQLDVAEIIDLSVAERFRGQGHGRALLEAAEPDRC